MLHGYLENQLFAPGVERGKTIVWARGAALAGRPYLARAAEEHGGPHMPWFWRGDLQGGGVLNDMMCHSLEVGRYLLTEARRTTRQHSADESVGADRDAQVVAARVRRAAAKRRWRSEVDYSRRPAEDFARATVNYVDEAGPPADRRSDDVVELSSVRACG